MTKRQKANLKIVWILLKLIVKYKDLRFSQILSNFGFVTESDIQAHTWKDEYYKESYMVLRRVNKTISKMD